MCHFLKCNQLLILQINVLFAEMAQKCDGPAFCLAVAVFIASLRIASFWQRCGEVTLRTAFCFKRCAESFHYFLVCVCLGSGWKEGV